MRGNLNLETRRLCKKHKSLLPNQQSFLPSYIIFLLPSLTNKSIILSKNLLPGKNHCALSIFREKKSLLSSCTHSVYVLSYDLPLPLQCSALQTSYCTLYLSQRRIVIFSATVNSFIHSFILNLEYRFGSIVSLQG